MLLRTERTHQDEAGISAALLATIPWQAVAITGLFDKLAPDDGNARPLHFFRRSVPPCGLCRHRNLITRWHPLGKEQHIRNILDLPNFVPGVPFGTKALCLILFRERNLQICSHIIPI